MHASIAILTGGTSSEREIALQSAVTVQESLLPFFEVTMFDFPNDIDTFLSNRKKFSAVVPVFHGKGGEDGTIQGFLKTLNLPFIFSDVEAHAVAINKAVTKQLVERVGIQTPASQIVRSFEEITLNVPFVLKPIDEGSSVGVRIIRADETVVLTHPTLVEAYISGREFTVPVIDRSGKTEALPVIEIRSKKTFFDFESKYDPNLVDEICPAQIDVALADRLKQMAMLAHKTIGARHLSRTDMIVDEQNEIWFLEINTIPGLTKNSLVPKALRAAGIDFGSLLKEWISSVQTNEV